MTKFKNCEHVMQNGNTCGSPALRGKRYCYYHQRMATGEAIRSDHPCRLIPTLKSPSAINIAATQIVRQALLGRITQKELKLLMNVVRLANNNLTGPRDFDRIANNAQQRFQQ